MKMVIEKNEELKGGSREAGRRGKVLKELTELRNIGIAGNRKHVDS